MNTTLKTAVAALALVAGSAGAQDRWPARPVRLVVPSSPGGGTDVYARILAQGLTEQLKQPFIVDNKPGASGNIGADAVAKAEPDGHTFLVASNASLGINPGLYKKLPFDIERDLAPVTRGVMAPMVIVAGPSLGVKTFQELVDLGKRQPGKVFYGSAGVGSPPYLSVRMIEEATGARFSHVPYKGVAPAYQDLLGGQLQFMMTDLATVQPHIAAGKVLPLAVSETMKQLPGIPRFDQTSYGKSDFWTSFSVMAPARVPPAIVQRLAAEIGRVMKTPAVAAKLEQQALVPVFDTPEQFGAALKKEREHWGAFIRRHNITPEL